MRMQKRGVLVVFCVFVLAISALPGIGVSPRVACEDSIDAQFKEQRDLNAADTNVDGNVYTHYWGCSECSASYKSCTDGVDAAWSACVTQSGSGNTCSQQSEPNYYGCANSELSCCQSIVKQQDCGSLSDQDVAEAEQEIQEETDTRSPQEICVQQGLYYIDGGCYGREEAHSLCQSKYGERGYVGNDGVCNKCDTGYRFDTSENGCVPSQDCSRIAHSHWEDTSQSCACDTGYVPMASGGCQESTRKEASFRDLVREIRFTMKTGRKGANIVDFTQSGSKEDGPMLVKVSSSNVDQGIVLKFNPLTQSVPTGQTKRFTITATPPKELEPGTYTGTISWSGYDNKYLYSGTTKVTVKIVQEDELFMPESEGQIIAEFSQARFDILPVLADKFHYGTEKRTRLNTILGSLNDKNPEDLQKMATIAGFMYELNFIANDNPFSPDDTEMIADALINVAEHRGKLEAAHRKLQEVLRAQVNQ